MGRRKQITRDPYCASNPGENAKCNGLNSEKCKANDLCHWVPRAKIDDKGLKGKTPESEKVLPALKPKGLSKFFPDGEMVYEPKECVIAGMKAKESRVGYPRFSAKFVAIKNYNANQNPKLAKQIEECRQFALIGYDSSEKKDRSDWDNSINIGAAKGIKTKIEKGIF